MGGSRGFIHGLDAPARRSVHKVAGRFRAAAPHPAWYCADSTALLLATVVRPISIFNPVRRASQIFVYPQPRFAKAISITSWHAGERVKDRGGVDRSLAHHKFVTATVDLNPICLKSKFLG
jgi:hypothetical protein